MLGHHWSTRVRSATDAVIRLAAGEGRRCPGGGHRERTARSRAALREIERGMQDGLQRVGEGYAAMALQLVDGLERRRLVAPAGTGSGPRSLAARLAERLQLLPADRQELELACRLVDLGKAFVRPALLQKQGPLGEVGAAVVAQPSGASRRAARLRARSAPRRQDARHQLERYDGAACPTACAASASRSVRASWRSRQRSIC
jgi:response regulator RpfG family c-di-GMP phosphodiesterase